jgi:ABC-type xylose transport system substrate-binding protein
MLGIAANADDLPGVVFDNDPTAGAAIAASRSGFFHVDLRCKA